MGNEASSEADVAAAGGVDEAEDPRSGYRVMKVFRGSAAARCGLKAYEDFVVGVLDAAVTADNGALGEVLAAHEDRDVQLEVYNVIDGASRRVALRPAKWNGPGLLGAAVRYEAVAGAADAVWHVLDVAAGSPAHNAGLVPATDYIVGSPAQAFRAQGEFSRIVADCLENASGAEFMVYSTATNRARNVELRPQEDWGGEGVLGCELATGLLHRIRRAPPAQPTASEGEEEKR